MNQSSGFYVAYADFRDDFILTDKQLTKPTNSNDITQLVPSNFTRTRATCYKRMIEDTSGNWSNLLVEWYHLHTYDGITYDNETVEFHQTFWSQQTLFAILLPTCFWVVSLIGAWLSALVFYQRRKQGATSMLLAVDFCTDVLAAIFALLFLGTYAADIVKLHHKIWFLVIMDGYIVNVGVNALLTASDYFAFVTTIVEAVYNFMPNYSQQMCNKFAVLCISLGVYIYAIGRNCFQFGFISITEDEDGGWQWTHSIYRSTEEFQEMDAIFNRLDLVAKSFTALFYMALSAKLVLGSKRDKRRLMSIAKRSTRQSTDGGIQNDMRTTFMLCIQCTIIFAAELFVFILQQTLPYTMVPHECSSIEDQTKLFSTVWGSSFQVHATNTLKAVSIGYYLFPAMIMDSEFRRDVLNIVCCRTRKNH